MATPESPIPGEAPCSGTTELQKSVKLKATMKRFLNIWRAQSPQRPPKWVPVLGELQKTLQKGEYLPLRPLPMFESNFVQVTNHGGPVFVHQRTNKLTMGVAASLPGLVLPDILLIARPPESRDCAGLILTRMIPLDLVHLYVHDLPRWRIKLRLITGRYYYLELDAPDHELSFLFDRWIRLINLLHEPTMTWVPRTLHTPPLDMSLEVAPASTWQLQNQAPSGHTIGVAEKAFPYTSQNSHKQRKVKNLKYKLRSKAACDSLPLVPSKVEHPSVKKKPTEKSHPDACPDRSNTQIHVSDKTSITIRTIFSIISSAVNENQSSLKVCKSDSEGSTGREGFIETPSYCISGDSPDSTLLSSYNHMDTLMWPQDFEDLMDPESSTLSSSLQTSPYPPALYCFPPYPSFPRSKAKPRNPMKYQRQVPFKKAPPTPTTLKKPPFSSGQSHRVREVPASSRKDPAAPRSTQKAPAIPALCWKAPPSLPVPQKSPARPGNSLKTPARLAPPHKTLPLIQKFLPTSAIPKKAMPPPVPKKHLIPYIATQKSPTSLPQYKPTSWAKALVHPGMLPAGIPGGDVLGRNKSEGEQEPMMMVGVHEAKVINMRTQTKTLELPSTTTKDAMVPKSQEATLENMKSRKKLEDRSHKIKEETVMDPPDRKSEETGQQKLWVRTQEWAMEVPSQEYSRPFSAEGLALAKLMIIANSKEHGLKPPRVSLPSWISMASRASAMPIMANVPLTPSQMTSVVVREQPESHTRENNVDIQQWPERKSLWDPVRPSKVSIRSMPSSDSLKMASTSKAPIPLPAIPWDDLQKPTFPELSISEVSEMVSRKPTKYIQKTLRVSNQGSLAMSGLSSDIFLPLLLEIESLKSMVIKAKEKPEELDVDYPPSTQY